MTSIQARFHSNTTLAIVRIKLMNDRLGSLPSEHVSIFTVRVSLVYIVKINRFIKRPHVCSDIVVVCVEIKRERQSQVNLKKEKNFHTHVLCFEKCAGKI